MQLTSLLFFLISTAAAATLPGPPAWVMVPPTTAQLQAKPWKPIQDANNQSAASSSGMAGIMATGGVVSTGAASTNPGNIRDGVGAGVDRYQLYFGDGTVGAGWPDKSRWVSFENMFNNYKAQLFTSCARNWGLPNNSGEEIGQIWNAIQNAAGATRVDHRFILAVIMQESAGCVRVKPTFGFWRNPGLMQSANGQNQCNDGNGHIQTPCPTGIIFGMVHDGSGGTPSGDGLAQGMNRAGVSDVSAFYKAARLYNSGSIPSNGDLTGAQGAATRCYASDIANRLTGWVNAQHGCNL